MIKVLTYLYLKMFNKFNRELFMTFTIGVVLGLGEGRLWLVTFLSHNLHQLFFKKSHQTHQFSSNYCCSSLQISKMCFGTTTHDRPLYPNPCITTLALHTVGLNLNKNCNLGKRRWYFSKSTAVVIKLSKVAVTFWFLVGNDSNSFLNLR